MSPAANPNMYTCVFLPGRFPDLLLAGEPGVIRERQSQGERKDGAPIHATPPPHRADMAAGSWGWGGRV